MAHGKALRIRVIKAVVEDGLSRTRSRRRAARRLCGSTGIGRSVLKQHRNWLLELRRKENDLTLDAIAERLLRTRGVKADKSMLSRFFAAEGISFKKNSARQRTKSSRRR